MRRSRCLAVFLGIVVGAVAVAALLKLLVKPGPELVHDPNRPKILYKLPWRNPKVDLEADPEVDPDQRLVDSPYTFEPQIQFPLPRPRVTYGTELGAVVRGWPPKGGFLIMKAGPADLEFLGYDRFQVVWKPDPEDPGAAADEEAHCYKSTEFAAPLCS
jgi:hypothetical protein